MLYFSNFTYFRQLERVRAGAPCLLCILYPVNRAKGPETYLTFDEEDKS